MRSFIALGAALGVFLAAGAAGDASAHAKRRADAPAAADPGGAHPKSSYYRKRPQVRGYVQRRGGYSYDYPDVINTYGGSRTIYGSGLIWEHPQYQRQGGPFDHGFFFDSGVGPRSESIYSH